ncbi:MAG: phosphate starvation-inducible protein PsiF [Rhodoferax sp.]|jgi:hypothetical protein|nr:phosphate starvation-inducible protein PsiF [Rhodoferax sp.]
MKQLLSVAALGLSLVCGLAQAEDKARTPQQNKMAMCNKEAAGKSGDERRAFMKTCLSAGKSDAQQAKAKACNADATGKKGAERKAFLDECLKKA